MSKISREELSRRLGVKPQVICELWETCEHAEKYPEDPKACCSGIECQYKEGRPKKPIEVGHAILTYAGREVREFESLLKCPCGNDLFFIYQGSRNEGGTTSHIIVQCANVNCLRQLTVRPYFSVEVFEMK